MRRVQEGLGSAAKWKENLFQQSADRLRHNVNLTVRPLVQAPYLDGRPRTAVLQNVLPRCPVLYGAWAVCPRQSLIGCVCCRAAQEAVYGDEESEDDEDEDSDDDGDALFKPASAARERSTHGPDALVRCASA